MKEYFNKDFIEENENVKNINKRIINDSKNKEEFNIKNKYNNEEKINRDFMSVYNSDTIDFILCVSNREVPIKLPHRLFRFAKPPDYI